MERDANQTSRLRAHCGRLFQNSNNISTFIQGEVLVRGETYLIKLKLDY